MTIQFETVGGDYLPDVARKMCVIAHSRKEPVEATFNGVSLVATPNTTAEELEKNYDRQCVERRRAWEQSPEGIAHLAERKATVERRQREYDALVVELPALDMTNGSAILDWLERLQEATDDIDVFKLSNARIVKHFAAHGWQPDMNLGEDFDESDASNFLGYIIGLALDGLQRVGAPHGMVIHFADQWRRKFVASGAES